MMIRRKHVRSGLAAAALAVMIPLATPAIPSAAAKVAPPPPQVPIELNTDGFTIPGANPRPGGYITFQVSTTVAEGRWLALLRPRPGVGIEQVMKDFADGASNDPATRAAGIRAEYRDTDFFGGAAVYPGSPEALTQYLTEGRYYLVETSAADTSVVQTLDITSEVTPATPPRPQIVIDVGGRDRAHFSGVPTHIPQHATILYRNHYKQPEEAIFVGIKPGETHESVQAYFDAQQAGQPLPPNPFMRSGGGTPPISAGRTVRIQVNMPPGDYSLLSFLYDADTLVKQAYQGLHAELQVCTRSDG
ncbi:hypothetical protein J4573_00595 [Actinomadura barringtoniae]|uniref:Secreted protein n=1 Tax=Actinomadura barringtoniae TaxID=1427535 RepID=A0A939P946_9ACTN|nr:hypothetical protein [Actinomadura barringtoniae]MBO2445578.1 hypothetical protein [Actinomadura barringtoniae]